MTDDIAKRVRKLDAVTIPSIGHIGHQHAADNAMRRIGFEAIWIAMRLRVADALGLL